MKSYYLSNRSKNLFVGFSMLTLAIFIGLLLLFKLLFDDNRNDDDNDELLYLILSLLSSKSAVLKVPSSIIQQEYNYLVNPAHKDFSKIIIKTVDPFVFDERIKI